jgi:hypothetical protein
LSSHFADKFRAETVTHRATYSGVPDRSVVDLLGWSVEAEEQAAAGRRQCPEAVTELRAGYETADALRIKVAIRSAATNFARKPRVHALL